MQELLDEEYIFIHRFQSDTLEKGFSQYRQMSDGRVLVSLREELSTERILTCRSLLKQHQLLGRKPQASSKEMTKYLTFWPSMNQKSQN